ADGLTREQKLTQVAELRSSSKLPWVALTPNAAADWINQRTESFERFAPLVSKPREHGSVKPVLSASSAGLKTNRDAWVYNFHKVSVKANVRRMIEFFNSQVESRRLATGNGKSWTRDNDPSKFSWNVADAKNLEKLSPLLT